jgi:integrase
VNTISTFGDALDAYAGCVTPSKRGAAQERTRIRQLRADPIANIELARLQRADIRALRDRTFARSVTNSTWNRFQSLVNAVLGWCLHEHDIGPGKLASGLGRPENPARTRRLGPGELQRLLAVADGHWIADLLLLGIETTLRRGSLVEHLCWEQIDWEARTVRIARTKTGGPHVAPLSSRAVEVLQRRRGHYARTGRVFPVTPDAASHAFISLCKKAGIEGLRFHDATRAEGVSRLFEAGWAMNEVAAVSTHKSASMLMRYARHNDPAALAAKMG